MINGEPCVLISNMPDWDAGNVWFLGTKGPEFPILGNRNSRGLICSNSWLLGIQAGYIHPPEVWVWLCKYTFLIVKKQAQNKNIWDSNNNKKSCWCQRCLHPPEMYTAADKTLRWACTSMSRYLPLHQRCWSYMYHVGMCYMDIPGPVLVTSSCHWHLLHPFASLWFRVEAT